MRFHNREHAGQQLARLLARYTQASDAIVLGIPRGGVVVAHSISHELKLPLDVFLSQKLGVPGHEELAFGALTETGTFLNDRVVREAGLSPEAIGQVKQAAQEKLKQRKALFRRGKPPLDVRSRITILVDDGAATGASFHAAIEALEHLAPRRLVAALPVAPAAVCDRLRSRVDEFICILCPHDFLAVGEFYEEFAQVPEERVIALLDSLPGID